MTVTSQEWDQRVSAKVKELVEGRLEQLVNERVRTVLEAEGRSAVRPKRLAIASSKGTLDAAYPPLIPATPAARRRMGTGGAKESGVKLWPCQMTMDMMDTKPADLIEGLEEPVGAGTFLEYASHA